MSKFWNPEIAEKQRANRKASGNKITKRYEKTKNGFLMRVYRNMKSRVTGIQKEKAHIYLGLPIMSKEDFYLWAGADPDFNELFCAWTASGFPRAETPSIDRIDSSKGYEKGNVRWITHGENSRIATIARFQKAS